METIEYQIRQVTRYIVTRYRIERLCDDHNAKCEGGSTCEGEFDSEKQARKVMLSLARQDRHDRVPELRQMFVDGEPFHNEPAAQIA